MSVALPSFNLDDFLVEDLIDLAEVAGVDISALQPNGNGRVKMSPRMLAGVAWIIRRRENPGLTFDEVLKLPVGALTAGFGTGKEEQPAPPSPRSSRRSSRPSPP